jgi:hypothetical protein
MKSQAHSQQSRLEFGFAKPSLSNMQVCLQGFEFSSQLKSQRRCRRLSDGGLTPRPATAYRLRSFRGQLAPGPLSRPAHQHRFPIPCSPHWTSPTCAASWARPCWRSQEGQGRGRRRRDHSRPAHASQLRRGRRCSMTTAFMKFHPAVRNLRAGEQPSKHRQTQGPRHSEARQLRRTA